MTDSFVGIDIAGSDDLAKKLKALPPEAADAGVEAANEYILDVFKSYPSYNYFSRSQAYPDAPAGPGWFSAKQRRYVMARMSDGGISVPYSRTQSLRNAWRTLGYGVDQIVVNENPAAVYAYDDQRQARQMTGAGWKKLGETLRDRTKRIVEKFDAGVKRAIKKLGLE